MAITALTALFMILSARGTTPYIPTHGAMAWVTATTRCLSMAETIIHRGDTVLTDTVTTLIATTITTIITHLREMFHPITTRTTDRDIRCRASTITAAGMLLKPRD